MDIEAPDLATWLDQTDDAKLNTLPYGVIGIDDDGKTCRYSDYEAKLAGFDPRDVLGRHFFEEIGVCMNNGLVAKRFADAQAKNEPLDALIDYVLAFRSRRTPVRIRMLSSPASPTRYLLIQRLPQEAQ